MDSNLLGGLGTLTAIAALLTTAWQGYLLRNQLAHSERVSRAQFYQQVTAMCLQRDQIFIEHPELWAYFYEGRKEPKRRSERARVLAMARIIANLADGLASETISDDFDHHWNRYFQYTYDNSPTFQYFWKEHGHFWPEKTRQRFTKVEDRV